MACPRRSGLTRLMVSDLRCKGRVASKPSVQPCRSGRPAARASRGLAPSLRSIAIKHLPRDCSREQGPAARIAPPAKAVEANHLPSTQINRFDFGGACDLYQTRAWLGVSAFDARPRLSSQLSNPHVTNRISTPRDRNREHEGRVAILGSRGAGRGPRTGKRTLINADGVCGVETKASDGMKLRHGLHVLQVLRCAGSVADPMLQGAIRNPVQLIDREQASGAVCIGPH